MVYGGSAGWQCQDCGSRVGGGVVPAPAPTTTVVVAAATGPFARAQLDANALAAAIAPIQIAHRVALKGMGVGE